MSRRVNEWPEWPDARGWVGISVVGLSVMLLWMMKDPALREDESFQTIATLVIGTGFVSGVVGWAYAATKSGGEAAQSSARIAEEAATAAIKTAAGAAPTTGDVHVEGENVTVEETKR